MFKMNKNKSYFIVWFLALSFISVLSVISITDAQELRDEMNKSTEEMENGFFKEPSSNDQKVTPREESIEEKMFRERKERMHPKIKSSLLWELQEEYINKGPEAAHEFARTRVLKIEEGDKITVILVLEAGRTIETINRGLLEAYGVEIIKGVDNLIVAKIPISLLTQVVDHVEGISYIRLPGKPKPLS